LLVLILLTSLDNGKESVSLSLHRSLSDYKSEGASFCFFIKEFAEKNKINFDDLLSKPFALQLEVTPNEFLRLASHRIFTLSQAGTNIITISLGSYNMISLHFFNESILTKGYLSPATKSVLEIYFHNQCLSIALNFGVIAELKVNEKAILYLEKALVTLGGHGVEQKYEYELFKGVVHGFNAVFPASLPVAEYSCDSLDNFKLCTEHENIDTLQQLYEFTSYCIPHVKPSLVPLRPRGISSKENKRSVLVCHDSPTDINEDMHLYGDRKTSYGYRFRFWQNIDYFCYFGHHLVVIPPPGYTAAGHRQGVKVLGTFITESTKGEQFNDFIFQDLSPDGKTKLKDFFYADKLVEICKVFGFDGYLINIEARVLVELMPRLIAWLQYLRFRLKQEVPHAEVVWYDSIIENGKVAWQSALNERNSFFLDVVDKFFTDYHWKLENLRVSVNTGKERSWDVMFGNDVYGRGTYGGGMLNTYIALNEILRNPLSIAIFAQAYYYQNGLL